MVKETTALNDSKGTLERYVHGEGLSNRRLQQRTRAPMVDFLGQQNQEQIIEVVQEARGPLQQYTAEQHVDMPVPQLREEFDAIQLIPLDRITDLEAERDRLRKMLEHVSQACSTERAFFSCSVMWHSGTEVQTEERNSQEQCEEFTTESAKSRADKVKETTALNDSERTLESNTTDTKSEIQSAQSSEAEEKNSQEQYEEFTIELSKSRADVVKETTALNDSNGILESSINDAKSELQSAQFSAAEEKNSQEQIQYEEFTIESSKSRSDKVSETTALNDDPKENLKSSITQYEEFMTESSKNRADKKTTALESESDLEVSSDEKSSDKDWSF